MSPDALSGFHPAVAGWFRSRFPAPTEAQARAWAVTTEHRNVLIAAPTGSGKTLAAFLSAINDLVVEGLERGLSDEVHVLYVSPLKALSNDIQKNLQEPLAGIRDRLLELGLDDVPVRDAVRAAMTGPVRIVGSAADLLAAAWPKRADQPLAVTQSIAPDIGWVARLGAVVEGHGLPTPLYLRAPDAQPQDNVHLPRR